MTHPLKLAATLSAILALSGCGSETPEPTVSRSESGSARLHQPVTLIQADADRLSSGINFVSGLASTGQVYAWGGNSYGQLGMFQGAASPAPVMVAGLSSITAVRAGGYHGAALRSDGTVWTWGNNSYGQLGIGGLSAVVASPRMVTGISGVKALAAGYSHTAALTAGGVVWSWGKMPGRYATTPAKLWGMNAPVHSIAAGADFALALGVDGSLYGWGGNASGQTGIGRFNSTVPNPVKLPGLTMVQAMSAGRAHALALRSDGTVWAWGSNSDGQLGAAGGDSARARAVAGLPTPLAGAASIKAIVAGVHNSAVIYADGSVWMWGGNGGGQFGDGSVQGSPVPVKLNALSNVAAITIGEGFVSVLKKDGTVYGTGANGSGQLGNNTMTSTRTPVQVSGLSGFGYLKLGASAGR